MEFFIDGADIEAIRELCSYLPVDAVDEFTANWEKAYGRTCL